MRVARETARRELVVQRSHCFNGVPVYSYSTDWDLIGRPTNAVDSLSSARDWRYNRRSELVDATIGTNLYGYAYDSIGNRQWASANVATNVYAANALNQYTSSGSNAPATPPVAFSYDSDGNLTNDGTLSYSYDAENRLVSVCPLAPVSGSLAVENGYDHRHRRIRKVVRRYDGADWQISEMHTFVWDGMNVVLEKISFADNSTRTCEYFWGPDKSGTEQGAGGVGGLLAASVDGQFYIPCYDHNGNIVCYVSETGNIAAQYLYDPYGNVIDECGAQRDAFAFGFSTKYRDRETNMLAYQRRFYRPDLGRWLNRDPIEEAGGENLYAFCGNNSILFADMLGLSFWDNLIDAAKVVVGFCGVVTGAAIGSAASWTGIGGAVGFSIAVIGMDQIMEGLESYHSRMTGGPATDSSPIKEVIKSSAYVVTGERNSNLEQVAISMYTGVQWSSSCYSGYVALQGAVQAVRLTYVPAHSVRVLTSQDNVLRYTWRLKAGFWKISGGSEASQAVIEISVDGVTHLKHESEGVEIDLNDDLKH